MAVSRRSTRSLGKPAAPDKLEPTCCAGQVNHTDNAFREPSRAGAEVSSPDLRSGRCCPLPTKLNRRTLSQAGGTETMRDYVQCEFPAGYDGAAIRERLAQVLDPELDEPILDLGFVRGLRLRSGHAEVALRLPTSWCAVNFAFLMAEDVRHALLAVEGIRWVTVSLGDHCAANEI